MESARVGSGIRKFQSETGTCDAISVAVFPKRASKTSRISWVNIRKVLSRVPNGKESESNVTNIYIGGDVKGSTIIAGDENEVTR